jgi:hypothetical protein
MPLLGILQEAPTTAFFCSPIPNGSGKFLNLIPVKMALKLQRVD